MQKRFSELITLREFQTQLSDWDEKDVLEVFYKFLDEYYFEDPDGMDMFMLVDGELDEVALRTEFSLLTSLDAVNSHLDTDYADWDELNSKFDNKHHGKVYKNEEMVVCIDH